MVLSILWWASNWDQVSILINSWNLGYYSVRKSISTKAGRTCTASLHDEDVFSLWLIQGLHYLQTGATVGSPPWTAGRGSFVTFLFQWKGPPWYLDCAFLGDRNVIRTAIRWFQYWRRREIFTRKGCWGGRLMQDAICYQMNSVHLEEVDHQEKLLQRSFFWGTQGANRCKVCGFWHIPPLNVSPCLILSWEMFFKRMQHLNVCCERCKSSFISREYFKRV